MIMQMENRQHESDRTALWLKRKHSISDSRDPLLTLHWLLRRPLTRSGCDQWFNQPLSAENKQMLPIVA